MVNEIENVVSQFQQGGLSRRQLVGALMMMVAPGVAGTASAQAKAVTPGKNLNHVHLYIPDLDKAIKFYADVLGTTIRDTSPDNATLSLPSGGWISLTKFTKDKPYINHVGYGVDFNQKGGDATRVADAINKMYPEAKARPTGPTVHGPNTRSVYLYDPNGIYLQIVPKEDDGWLPTGPVGSKILKGEKG